MKVGKLIVEKAMARIKEKKSAIVMPIPTPTDGVEDIKFQDIENVLRKEKEGKE